MPLSKRKYDHIKVYRPNGHRYAEGTGKTWEQSIQVAYMNFLEEFDGAPHPVETVIEVVGATGIWIATVSEIKD